MKYSGYNGFLSLFQKCIFPCTNGLQVFLLRQVFANFVRGYTIAPPIINFGHLIFAKFNKFLHSSLGVGSFKILTYPVIKNCSTFKKHKFVNAI